MKTTKFSAWEETLQRLEQHFKWNTLGKPSKVQCLKAGIILGCIFPIICPTNYDV